jgi:hypothetical protein
MTCPVCNDTGLIVVNTHGPNEEPRGEQRPCFCGTKPTFNRPTIAADNQRVEPFRVKLGAVNPKPMTGKDPDYNGPDEPIDWRERWT